MKCPRCQHENETGAKFCEECAAPLARACAKCGRQLSPTAKFCPECAHPTGLSAAPSPAQRFDSPESYTPKHLAEKILTSKASLEGERKQVTVLFQEGRAHWIAWIAEVRYAGDPRRNLLQQLHPLPEDFFSDPH